MDSTSYKYQAFPNTARISDVTSSRASFTAPDFGWVRFTYTGGSMNTASIWINGQLMMDTTWANNWNAGNGYLTWPMNPGDKLTSSGLNAGRLIFWYARTS